MDIRKEDVVQARNGWVPHIARDRNMEGEEYARHATYGNCGRCGQGGPIGTECSQCVERPPKEGEVTAGAGRPVYQLFQIDDMFLDSCLIAEIYGKGHDVAKARHPAQAGSTGERSRCSTTTQRIISPIER